MGDVPKRLQHDQRTENSRRPPTQRKKTHISQNLKKVQFCKEFKVIFMIFSSCQFSNYNKSALTRAACWTLTTEERAPRLKVMILVSAKNRSIKF